MTSTFMNFLIDACLSVCDFPDCNRAGFVNKLAFSDVVTIDSFLENHKDLPYTSEPNAHVILVENTRIGYANLENEIGTLHGLAKLHILSYGKNECFALGGRQLNELNINELKNFWRVVSKAFASEKSELPIYSSQLAGSSFSQVSVLPPAKSNSTPANAVTGVSTKANILLNANRPINSVAGKNIVINRVSDRLRFAAIPTTEPQVSVNSTISITTNRTRDLTDKASYYG